MMSKRMRDNTSIRTYSNKKIKTEPDNDCARDITITCEGVKMKEEKDAPSFDNTPFLNPIVVTKKLEDMCIMQKKIQSKKPEYVLKEICKESKPENFLKKNCKCCSKTHKIKFSKLKWKLAILNIQRDKKKYSHHNINEHIIDLNSDDESLVIEKRSQDIKVEYQYISKIPQSNPKTKIDDIIELSSDDEVTMAASTQHLKKVHTNLTTHKNANIKPIEHLKKSRTINSNIDKAILAKNYDSLVHNMKMITDLNVINDLDEKNCSIVIVINNLFLNQMDIYGTNKTGHVLEFETISVQNYYLLNKMFSTDIYKQLLWIDCCCWTKRQKEIEKRLSKEYILKYVSTPHTCWSKCSCCCNYVKIHSNLSNDSVPDLDTGVKSKVNSLLCKKFTNNLIETALHYKKPIQQRTDETLDKSANEQKSYKPIALQFEFLNAKYQKHCVKNIKSTLPISNGTENNVKMLVHLGTKREIMSHTLIDDPKLDIYHNQQSNIYKQKICCKFYIENLLKRLSTQYFAHPVSSNYLQQILETNIYESTLRGCLTKCHNKNKIHINPNISPTQLKSHKAISMIREHTRKSIKGEIIRKKTNEIDQTIDENLHKMQDMIKKVEEKFQNAIFFINDKGLAVATLALPYNFYPIEDLKILNKVLEFTQAKIAHLDLPTGTAITLDKKRNECRDNNKYNVNIPTYRNENNNPATQATEGNNKLFDSCSILIKCNTISYSKSFESFVCRPSRRRKECDRLPKILNVCSLSENVLMANKIQKAPGNKSQTLVIDSDSSLEPS